MQQDRTSPATRTATRRAGLRPVAEAPLRAAAEGRSQEPSTRTNDAPTEREIATWIEAAVGGDKIAFERLYRLHVCRVYALCLRMTGNPNEAEEMTQEAFIRAWEKLSSFRGDSAFSSWLHRLTVNLVLARWRAAGRYRDRVVPIEDAARWTEPEDRQTKGLALDLEQAIGSLPDGARTVFVLHDVEGLMHREISERVGIAVGTSKTQLHRARKLLRDALGSGAA